MVLSRFLLLIVCLAFLTTFRGNDDLTTYLTMTVGLSHQFFKVIKQPKFYHQQHFLSEDIKCFGVIQQVKI